MARTPRGETAQSIYHVISRGVDRRAIFLNDDDRRFFLALLREAFRSMGISLYAYCLMGNHFHLMLGTGDTPLSAPMHQLLMRYSLHFNGINGRVGHLFESRYKAVPCRGDRHLIGLIAYIHRNPVRARLATAPAEWPWSSHIEFSVGAGDLLALDDLAERTGYSIDELRAFYADSMSARPAPEEARDLKGLIAAAAECGGVSLDSLLRGERGKFYTRAKRSIVKRATAAGYTLSAIARELGCTHSALSRLMRYGVVT